MRRNIKKVRVIISTYNHEKYISTAVNSVLAQKAEFDYEIVVLDDFSTDRTGEIVLDFQRRHPDRISVEIAERNMADLRAFARAIEAAQTDYIAVLDGDDYWTSCDKLQKQVEVMETNPSCSICFHNALVVYEDMRERPHPYHYSPRFPKSVSNLEDIVTTNFIPTCSILFRRGLFGRFPPWYYDMALGDWPLHVLNAQHGEIRYINEMLSTYRIHSGGLWSRISAYRELEDLEGMLECYDTIDRHLRHRYSPLIERKRHILYAPAARLYWRAGRRREALRYAKQYLMGVSLRRLPVLCKEMLRVFSPRSFHVMRSLVRRTRS